MCSMTIISINFQILSRKGERGKRERGNLATDSSPTSPFSTSSSIILVHESFLGGCILSSYPCLAPWGVCLCPPLFIYFDETEDKCEVKAEMGKEKQQARCTSFNHKSRLNLNAFLKLLLLYTFEKSLRPKVSIL